MALTDFWPQFASHELRRSVFQARRIYSGDLTPAVTFGDRPLWHATLDFGNRTPAKAAELVAAIAEVETAAATWPLYKPGKHNSKFDRWTRTWGVVVRSYSTADGTITFRPAHDDWCCPGELVQVGRYVLEISKVTGDDGETVHFVNFPEAISDMTPADRNALVMAWNGDNETEPLTIQARVRTGRAPAIEQLSSRIHRVLPVSIVEVA